MIEVRVAAPDEVGGALTPIWHYFGSRPEPEELERLGTILPPERVHAAFENGAIVGGAGAYRFETTVPGGAQVPTAGVMAVGVLPTHRRRGALTKLMRRQLADAHERGEPLATLYASEGAIYSRFGYGLASLAGHMELPKEHALLWDDEQLGQARLLGTEDEALEVLPGIYDRAQAETVGMFTRTPDWWRVRRLNARPGRGQQVRVAIELEGRPEAYALYRIEFAARHMVAETRLEVYEALGTSPQALAAIWRYVLGIDWVARIDASWLPLDHPLFLWLREPRRMTSRWARRSGCAWSTWAPPSPPAVSGRARSCWTSATSSARGTRRAGGSAATRSTGRRQRPTCASTPPSSAPSTSAASHSTSCGGQSGSRS